MPELCHELFVCIYLYCYQQYSIVGKFASTIQKSVLKYYCIEYLGYNIIGAIEGGGQFSAKKGDAMTINVRINNQTVAVEVIRKICTGFRATHNHDGQYGKMWVLAADGTVYTTKSTGRYRIALHQDVPPPSLFHAA